MDVLTMADLEQIDRDLGLDDDPLDDDDLLDELVGLTGMDDMEELSRLIGAAGVVVRTVNPGRLAAVRKCKDCPEPARPRKSPRGRWPERCEPCTKARKKWLDSGGSKARPQYRQCCVQFQLDPDPAHRGLCPQCRAARKAAREEARKDSRGNREARWLVNALGSGGWHIEKAGWLRE